MRTSCLGLRVFLFTFWIALSLAWSQSLEPVSSPEELLSRYPALREIEIPEITPFTLSNGMRVYFLEDHTLPIVTGSALIRTGNLFDPPDRIGLAEITGSVLRVGGTQSRTGEEIDQQLESLAASVETGIGETSGRARFWTLTEHLDVVLNTYAEILTQPAFRQDKLDFIKQRIRSGIARRNDSAAQIAEREFNNLVYGKETPYGWQVEYEHLGRIEGADLKRFYERYFFPENVILSVFGDFSIDEMKAKLETVFKDWNVERPPVPPFPKVRADDTGGTYLVVKQDLNQSSIRFGHLGGTLRDEDYPALKVMSTILGGGFQSRLFQRVRSQLGLAYQASANWGAFHGHPGLFRVSVGTKSETTVQAIEAVRKEIQRIRAEPVTREELRTAKDTVLNSFVFNFDTRREILERLMTYRYWDYPEDFIFQYRDKIREVTVDEIQRVAQHYLRPDKMTLLVVGKMSDFDKSLDVLGSPVTEIDITIPEPEQELAKADASTIEKGRAILAKAQQAAGGADQLAAVEDITWSAKLQVVGGRMSAEQTTQIVMPDVLRQENQLPFGKVVVFVQGNSGWMQTPQGRMPLPSPQLKQSRGVLFRNYVSLLLSDQESSRTVNFVGRERLNDRIADVIEISSRSEQSVRLWVEASTGGLLKSSYRGTAMSGPSSVVEEVYTDFRDVGGLRFPFNTTIFQDGEEYMKVDVLEVRFNTNLQPEKLASP